MDAFLEERSRKKGLSPGLLLGIASAVVVMAALIGLFYLMSGGESEEKNVLEGAVLEGTEEFDKYTNEIIITTNPDRLMQSRTGLGTITMHIGGSVYNKGERVLDTLQVRVSVIDPENEVIKEKKFILVPNSQRDTLDPGKTITVNVSIGGFSETDDRANVRWKVTAFKFADAS